MTTRRILIVDDSVDDRADLRRMLLLGTDDRLVFTELSLGSAAIAALHTGTDDAPDCVLLDYHLPDMDAVEVLAGMQSAEGVPMCPVVVVTGEASLEFGREVLRAGAQDHIAKAGLTPALLTRAVSQASDRWALALELRQRNEALHRIALRTEFFLALAEATRGAAGPQAVKAQITRLLGQHLNASRCIFAEVHPDGGASAEHGFVDGVAQLEGGHHLPNYGDDLLSELQAGRVLVVNDLHTDASYTVEQRAAHEALAIVAHVAVPLMQSGRLLAVLAVHDARPRRWSADEIALVKEVAERSLVIINHARAEIRLHEEGLRLRLALQAGGLGSWQWEFGSPLVHLDATMRLMVGLPPGDADQLVPLAALLPLLDPDDRAAGWRDILALQQHDAPLRRELRIVRSDGSTLWLECQAAPLVDAAHERRQLVGVTADITERKAAEAARHKNELRLQQLIQLMPSFTAVLKGPDHVFELANEPYYALVGRGPQILGLPLLQALPEIAEQPFPALLDEVYRSGVPFHANSMPVRLARQAGQGLEERFVDFAYMPLREAAGAVTGILIHGVDRTEQVRAERALLESDRRKDEFLATLAHELRNPLAPVRNGVAILRRLAPSGANELTLSMMERQLGHLVTLLDDLLDVSRISLGKIELRRERVNVAQAIATAVEASRPVIEAGRHDITVEATSEPLTVDADPTRLVQIVVNLVVNSAKYSEPGGHIRVSTSREANWVVIRVSDRGIGIAPEVLPTLWNMFTQVRDTLHKAQGGLGIGLSLVKQLVHLHGGSVDAQSAGIGQGSTFAVRLPLASALAASAVEPPAAVEPAANTRARRVLIVDDNVDAAQSLGELMKMCGFQTRVAHDGPSALQLARSFEADVMVLDIGLPGMDGYELARRVRIDPQLSNAVLVALTGWGADGDKQMAISAGFDFHFTKPIDVAELERVLKPRVRRVVSR